MKQVPRPDVQAFLDALNQTPLATLEALGPEAARALTAQFRSQRPAVPHGLSVVVDLECPGPAGPIPLRFYDLRAERAPGPIVVYFHGGGFVLGDLESHHQVCVDIATQVDVPVVSVDYRLAPEHPFPAAFDDALAASRWVSDTAPTSLDRDATSLVLMGDSAGGNLAAVVAAALHKTPAKQPVLAQVLIYPTTGEELETGSNVEFSKGYFLSKASIDWFQASYAAPTKDPRYDFSATDLSAAPQTLLLTAGLDPLRDAGRAYAAALIEAGGEVTYQEAAGIIHGFFSAAAVLPSAKDDIRKALGALRQMIAGR